MAGALIAGVPSAVFVLFRLIDTVLGGRAIALGSDLSIPLAVVLVAAIVATYHGRLVVFDLRLASASATATADRAPAAKPVTILPATLALVLRGQVDEDLEAVVASLREHLPQGVVLERG